MGEKIPLHWLQFDKNTLKEVSKCTDHDGTPVLNLKEVIDICCCQVYFIELIALTCSAFRSLPESCLIMMWCMSEEPFEF